MLVELVVPVIFAISLYLICKFIRPKNFIGSGNYNMFDPCENMSLNKENPMTEVYYSPRPKFLRNIMNRTLYEPFKVDLNIRAFNTSTQALNEIALNDKFLLCYVQFPDSYYKIRNFPPKIEVTIRFPHFSRDAPKIKEWGYPTWRTESLFEKYHYNGPRIPENNTGGYPPGYNEEGFLMIQCRISLSIVRFYTSQALQSIQLKRFPYPPYTAEYLKRHLPVIIPFGILCGFPFSAIFLIKAIGSEKKAKLKGFMRIMGLPASLQWLAWLIKSCIFLIIPVTLVAICLTVQYDDIAVFNYTGILPILTLLSCYGLATITYAFMLSVLFPNVNAAIIVAGLLWFFSYLPYLIIYKMGIKNYMYKLLSCLAHNSAMAWAIQLLLIAEGTNTGINFNNINDKVDPKDPLVLLTVLYTLLIDAAIYLVIALYFDQLFPGDLGIAQPFYFPISLKFWFGLGCELRTAKPQLVDSGNFEEEPNLPILVKIINLTKYFGCGCCTKYAVNNLTLNLFQNQITTLIGHNGAGKTTVIAMLTGLIRPSSGTAKLAGFNIRRDLSFAHTSFGFCPDYNILFDYLTVEEHIYFFSRLKGLTIREARRDMFKYLTKFNLLSKRKTKTKNISIGMKRKLSIAIALCGQSRVVLLDEPTTGMDPTSKRSIWDIILREKKDRTVLLTTHLMDEADILSDRVAILSSGVLQCCGSPMFLKKRFSSGYQLVIMVEDDKEKINVYKINDLVFSHVKTASLISEIGSEIIYSLPDNQKHKFEALLRDIENIGPSIGISSFELDLNKLEDVFLKVGMNYSEEKNSEFEKFEGRLYLKQPLLYPGYIPEFRLLAGCELISNQIIALVVKKLLWTHWFLLVLFIQTLIIIAVITLIVIFSRKLQIYDSPAIRLDLSTYGLANNTFTIMSGSDAYFIANFSKLLNKSNSYPINATLKHYFDMDPYLLNMTSLYMETVRKRFITAVYSNVDIIIGWFNNNAYHSSAISLAMIYKNVLQKYTNTDLVFYNHPLPMKYPSRILQMLTSVEDIGFHVSVGISFAMAFVVPFPILHIIRERTNNVKHLQIISGVKLCLFWFISILWDITVFSFSIIATLLTLYILNEKGFESLEQLALIFFAILFFGISCLPITYLGSFFFNSSTVGYTVLTSLYLLTGPVCFIIYRFFNLPFLPMQKYVRIFEFVCMFFPHFSLAKIINLLYSNYISRDVCKFYCMKFPIIDYCIKNICVHKKVCCDLEPNYFKFENPGCGRFIYAPLTTGAVAIVLFFIHEFKCLENFFICFKTNPRRKISKKLKIDEDVLKEKVKIVNLKNRQLKTYQVAIKRLRKYSGYCRTRPIVNDLCIGLNKYECFGLLGVNGAGKTAIFRILTRCIKMSAGKVLIGGSNIETNLKKLYKNIGYCPQIDNLIEDMTGRQNLYIVGLIRGIPLAFLKTIANFLAYELDFLQFMDKKVKKYSGGTKRKLSIGIALLGYPDVILLDEPTTRLDPAGKRRVWDAIFRIRDNGHCIILASHDMEECEALCTRLAIMVNGTFQCLGSARLLKNKFSYPYTLKIRIKGTSLSLNLNDSRNAVKLFIASRITDPILVDELDTSLTYTISKEVCPWSQLFGIMETAKLQLNIEDYSISLYSLEQVFISYTKIQNEKKKYTV